MLIDRGLFDSNHPKFLDDWRRFKVAKFSSHSSHLNNNSTNIREIGYMYSRYVCGNLTRLAKADHHRGSVVGIRHP